MYVYKIIASGHMVACMYVKLASGHMITCMFIKTSRPTYIINLINLRGFFSLSCHSIIN